MKLTPAKQKEFKLFSKENPKHEQLMKVVDQLNFRENGKVKLMVRILGEPGKSNRKNYLKGIVQG